MGPLVPPETLLEGGIRPEIVRPSDPRIIFAAERDTSTGAACRRRSTIVTPILEPL